MAVAFLFSLVLSALCFIFLDPLCRFLGSDEALLHYCRQYMIPGLISIPFAVFGMMFQLSFITVGKAGLGAFLSVLGGVLNIMLDWLFMGEFDWGLTGAAIATGIGYAVPSVIGVIWFCANRKQALYVVRPKWRAKTIIDSCMNGSSEMVSLTTLCPICLDSSQGAKGVRVRRADPKQKIKDVCTYCQIRYGFDYYVQPDKNAGQYVKRGHFDDESECA